MISNIVDESKFSTNLFIKTNFEKNFAFLTES